MTAPKKRMTIQPTNVRFVDLPRDDRPQLPSLIGNVVGQVPIQFMLECYVDDGVQNAGDSIALHLKCVSVWWFKRNGKDNGGSAMATGGQISNGQTLAAFGSLALFHRCRRN